MKRVVELSVKTRNIASICLIVCGLDLDGAVLTPKTARYSSRLQRWVTFR